MEKFLTANIVRKSLLTSLLLKNPICSWRGKPASWPNIRHNAEDGHIYLLCDTRYPIGFTATATGGYIVNIDGEFYGSYNSNAQFSMADWSSYTDTEGYPIDYPTGATKAHIIDILPQTSGGDITAFQCKRVAASGREEQGVLWAHLNLTNAISIYNIFGSESSYRNTLLEAITAKNNLITYIVSSTGNTSGLYGSFANCSSLEYLPILKAENQTYPSGTYISFRNVSVKKVIIKNNNGQETFGMLNNTNIEEFIVENGFMLGSGMASGNGAVSPIKLKKFPKINENKYATFRLNSAPALEPTNIDDRFNDIRTAFHFYGTASNLTNLKSLRVSSSAPFDYATPPQINVNYTGMDRSALVQLFEDLPTVSDGQIISIVGATGASDLTADDELIATAKGWTIAK